MKEQHSNITNSTSEKANLASALFGYFGVTMVTSFFISRVARQKKNCSSSVFGCRNDCYVTDGGECVSETEESHAYKNKQ
jgi:hypothetical protein